MRVGVVPDEGQPHFVFVQLVLDLERVSVLQIGPDVLVVENQVDLCVVAYWYGSASLLLDRGWK